MSYLAQVTYTGNGSTTQYSITFPYIDSTHIKAFINGTQTTAFTVSSSTLTFTSAPANSAVIRIERQTPTNARIVDFTDGSVLTEGDLDKSADQNFFIAQEITDNSLSKLGLDTDDKFDADNKVIKNLANPVNNQDAVTKYYLENTWLSPTNKTALTTVNANIANINAVNSNASNINSAVSNATNINTVATNIGSVNTVATDIAKVIAVANDLAEAVSEVETVADDLNETSSEIEVVGGAITNVNNVGNNIANVNTVAGISANVTTVAGNNSNVSTVAGISSDVTAVAGISSDVQAVENIASNVTTVAGISSDVTSVAGISTAVSNVNSNSSNINAVNSNATNINTVAGNNSNISTVSGISGNVSTVAGISSDVTSVAGISSAVSTVSGMSTAINTVNSNATNVNAVAGAITNVNNVGGSIASVNSVATNLASVNSFANTYLGASSSAPTQDPDGSALDLGDLYFDTGSNQLKVYSSTGWVNAGSSVNGTSDRFKYTISGTPTTVSGNDDNSKSLSYDAGFIDVFLNGIKMVNGTDVTVTSGNSVVFASALTNGDVVDIITFGTFNIASMNASNLTSGTVPDARITGAYTGITGLTITSSAPKLIIQDSGTHGTNSAPRLEFKDTSSIQGFVDFADDGTMRIDQLKANPLTFLTNNVERMRIDSSGRLLVGKTSTTRTVVGAELRPDGFIRGTKDSAHSIDAVRTTDDGDVIRLYKDNTIAGVLGTQKWGIGNSNPQNKLDISATTWDDGLTIKNTGNFNVGIIADANRSGAGGGILNLASKWNGTEVAGILFQAGSDTTNKDDGEIVFRTASAGTPTERMRLDSSGNVFVKKTSSDGGQVGVELLSSGAVFATRDNNFPLFLNRTSSDGQLILFRKDGSTIGSIDSVNSAGIQIVSGSSLDLYSDNANGVRIDSTGRLRPINDNSNDLGNTNKRWNDLWLGGGLYVGGTGTANKLDDYEEGTWTPGLTPAGGNLSLTIAERVGKYTKIGNVVHYEFYIETSVFSGGTGSITFTGLPFTVQAGRGALGIAGGSRIDLGIESAVIIPDQNATTFKVRIKNSTGTGTSDNLTTLDASDWSNNNPTLIYGSGHYRTDA